MISNKIFKAIEAPAVFLPVENTPRELDYKLNFARHFCHAGYNVIIGNPPFIRDELKYKNYKGVFLEKGGNPTPEYYQDLRAKGILLYCLSDEGGATPAYSVTYQPAVDTLKAMDHIFLWGNIQKDDLTRRNPDNELCSKYHVAGYPGFEFSLPKYKEYHQKLKPKSLPENYILVNTNFNGFTLEEILKSCANMSPETYKGIEKSALNEAKSFEKFYEWLSQIIKAFPEEQFLIRPHPAEKTERYFTLFSRYKNVLISCEGNANQVISTAKIILHRDCTTALQGYLMGQPVISLIYSNIDYISTPWTLEFGALPTSVSEVITLINFVLKNGEFNLDLQQSIEEKAKRTLSNWFCNMGNSTKDISDIMISEMKKKWASFTGYKITDKRSLIMKFKLFIRKYLPLHYKIPVVARGPLVPFNEADIRERLNLMEKIDGLHLSCNIKKLYPNTFLITKSS